MLLYFDGQEVGTGMKKERDIQKEILKILKEYGGWWLNFHGGDPYMPRGIPDIIGCYKGRFVALEVKRPGEKPRAIQRKTLKTLEAAGARTAVVYSVDDVKKVIDEIGKNDGS